MTADTQHACPMISEVFGPQTARRIGLPAQTWTLALLQAVSAAVLVASATWPLSPQAPVHLARVLAAILVVETAATLAFSKRIGLGVLLGQAFVGIGMTVLITGGSTTTAGTLLSCAGYVWVAMWVAVFCAPRWLVAAIAAELAGAPIAALLNTHPLRALLAAVAMMVVSALLASVLAYLVGSLRRVALHDQLTGLLNRHGVDQALSDLHGRRRRVPISLVAIDIDGLKAVNDRGGHLAGDRMLVEFARALMAGARSIDLPARIGGDEFVVILPGLSAEEATRRADSWQAGSNLEWSFGVSERRSDEPLETWLSRADQRMYAAKTSGHRRAHDRAAARGVVEFRSSQPRRRIG